MNKNLTKIKNNQLIILLIFYSAIALIAAYISQYVFNFQPCILCLYQRIPFFLIIFIGAIYLSFKLIKFEKTILYLSIILLVCNASIAAYQFGVEQKIFQGPSNCQTGSNLNKIDNIEELAQQISKIQAVRCDKPNLLIFGLSIAFYNILYCLILVFATLYLIYLNKKQN